MKGSHTIDVREAADGLAEACRAPWPWVPSELDGLRERVSQLAGTLLPALEDADGPLLAVIVGATGAGKSTLLNGLAGRRVSAASVLRPTTGTPVAWCHPRHASRVRGWVFGGVAPEVTVDERPELADLVIVDAPDFDSAVAGHRVIADALLGAADVVVFVSSPARYGDRSAWDRVVAALSRDVPMLHVLNRCGPETLARVREELPGRARARGLPFEATEVIPVAEQVIDPETLGPPHRAVAHILSILAEIAEEDRLLARRFVREGAHRATAVAARELLDAARRWRDAIERSEAAIRSIVPVAGEQDPPPDRRDDDGPGAALAARLRRFGGRPAPSAAHAVAARLRVEALDAWGAMGGRWREDPLLSALPRPALGDVDRIVSGPAGEWLAQERPWGDIVEDVREAAIQPGLDVLAAATPDLDPIEVGLHALGDGG